MGLICYRFLFEADPPSLRSVYERVQAETGVPIKFIDRRHKGASLIVPRKYDRVGLVTVGQTIELHSALGAALTDPTAQVLASMGGLHPLPQADPENPDYGETWLGVLAEGDDIIFDAGDRTFRVWVHHLTPMEACATWFFGREADDAMFEGKSLSVSVDDVLRSLEGAPNRPVDERAREVLPALEAFVRRAAGRGIERLTVRAE